MFQHLRSLTDEQLMRLVGQGGHQRAFEELYRRYARTLKGFFFRRLGGNEALADDLLQDAFLRVWTARAAFSPSFMFRPWLFTIAYNLCRNTWRSEAQHEDLPVEAVAEEPAAGEQAPLLIDSSLFDAALRRELSLLKPGQQMLFELRFMQELSVPELALVLNLPEGTVKSRLHTLTMTLRKKLQPYE